MVEAVRTRFDLTTAARVGVYGGSFDPVHAGHVHVAREAQRAFALDAVVFVPAAAPPHKPGRALASPADRTAMLEIALAGEPSWTISKVEYERAGPSYTYDTLRELPARARLRADVALHFVIGWDNLRGLERWHRARELLALAQPIVVWRAGCDEAVLAHLERELGPLLYARLERGLVRSTPAPETSTEVREQLARGLDPRAALPPGVLEYIRARGIYAARDDAP